MKKHKYNLYPEITGDAYERLKEKHQDNLSKIPVNNPFLSL